MPSFPDCDVDTQEIPTIEGTCERVGVIPCDGGLAGPPDWKCEPIGPDRACRPGWRISDVERWCEPVLPEKACPAGQLAVIGEATCQPLGDCGAGPYGKLPGSGAVVYVDAAADASAGDGTKSAPFSSLQQALAAAPTGATVALAAGEYQGDLTVGRKLTIVGRCAAEVRITGKALTQNAAALTIEATGVVLRDLSLGGAAGGIFVNGGGVTLQRVAIEGCGREGLIALGGQARLVDAVVAGNTGTSVVVWGASVTVERSVVRDTRPEQGQYGNAFVVGNSLFEGALTLRDSLVSDNQQYALTSAGKMLLEGVVIRRTLGAAIYLEREDRETTLSLRGSLIAESHGAGVVLAGGEATIEDTVIRDTLPRDTGGNGQALIAEPTPDDAQPSKLTVRRSAFVRSHGGGVALYGTVGSVGRSLIRDTGPGQGVGIQVDRAGGHEAGLSLSDSEIAGCRFAGVEVKNSDVTSTRWYVDGTLDAKVKATYPASAGSDELLVGTGDEPANLELDELAFYDKALGVAQIAQRYAAGRP